MNIDDLHRYVWKIIQDCKEQQEEIKNIFEKLDVVSLLLTDTTVLKDAIDKVDGRIVLLYNMFLKIYDIQISIKNPRRNIVVL